MTDRWRAIQTPWWEHPDTIAWRETVAAQIEALRAAEGPQRCPTCGCSAHLPTRRCARCGEVKALELFVRDCHEPGGRRYQCRDCHAQIKVEYRREQKRRVVREILGSRSA